MMAVFSEGSHSAPGAPRLLAGVRVAPLEETPGSLERLGYAVRRHALDNDTLGALRAAFDEALAPGTPVDATDVLWLPMQQRLLSDPRILQPARAVFLEWLASLAGPMVPHCGDICRTASPGHRTLPHQDANYGGHHGAVTVWVAVDDVPLSHGPLILWPGSHRLGRLLHGPGSRGILDLPDDVVWHGSNLGAGDAIAFLSGTVHATLPNRSDHVRRSVDYRFWPA